MMIAIGIVCTLWKKTDLQMGLFLGEVALSTFLIVRFTLHNRSEGLGYSGPDCEDRSEKKDYD